jgi:hypothetical protein
MSRHGGSVSVGESHGKRSSLCLRCRLDKMGVAYQRIISLDVVAMNASYGDMDSLRDINVKSVVDTLI